MSKPVRIGIFVGIFGIVLTLGGFFFLTRFLRQNLAPLPAPTEEAALMEPVVVVTHDILMGEVIKNQDVRVLEVPAEAAPTGSIAEVEQVVGRYTKVDLVTGEMILIHNLADPNYVSHDIAYTLDDYQVLMALATNDTMTSLGIIQKGDVVDIFITIEQDVRLVAEDEQGFTQSSNNDEEKVTKTMTLDAFQGVSVTAMVVDIIEQEEQAQAAVEIPGGDTQEEDGAQAAQQTGKPQEYSIKSYLLALNPQDALVLKHFKDINAVFDFVVRAPSSDQIFELSPVTTEYLMDRYQLEAPR